MSGDSDSAADLQRGKLASMNGFVYSVAADAKKISGFGHRHRRGQLFLAHGLLSS
jgi:hypothetical protein